MIRYLFAGSCLLVLQGCVLFRNVNIRSSDSSSGSRHPVFFTYVNDGALYPNEGEDPWCREGFLDPADCRRDRLLRAGPTGRHAMEDIAYAGFRELVIFGYAGRVGSAAKARAYFRPLMNAVAGGRVTITPGFFLVDAIINAVCPDEYASCSYNPYWDMPSNPSGLLLSETWDFIESWSLRAAEATGSTHVAWEGETVFWTRAYDPSNPGQCHPFWSATNLAAVRSHLLRVLGRLSDRGIGLLFYHPVAYHPGSSCPEKIGRGLFRDWNETPELSRSTLMVPLPYFDPERLAGPTEPWESVDQNYRALLGSEAGLSQGFISEFNGAAGWNASRWARVWFEQRHHPAWKQGWFFTGTDVERTCALRASHFPSFNNTVTNLECATYELARMRNEFPSFDE